MRRLIRRVFQDDNKRPFVLTARYDAKSGTVRVFVEAVGARGSACAVVRVPQQDRKAAR